MALAALVIAPAVAQAPGGWTQIGVLTCRFNTNVGFIIVDHKPMKCEFQQAEANPPQLYQGANSPQLSEGAVNTVGLDVGVIEGDMLA
jgi:hypothetical protein